MNRIELKRRRQVFENARFRVFADHVAGGGSEVENYLVVAPHTSRADLVTGITVLPVWDGRIVLIENYRHAVGKPSLEGIRGFVDVGEDYTAAALRELEEESGLVCAREDLLSLGFCAPEGSTLAARVAMFAATACRPGGRPREDEPGLGEMNTYTRAEIERMLPEMEDASTCLALHRYFDRIDRQ